MLTHNITIEHLNNKIKILIYVHDSETDLFTMVPLYSNKNNEFEGNGPVFSKKINLVFEYLINNNLITIINTKKIDNGAVIYDFQLSQLTKLKLI